MWAIRLPSRSSDTRPSVWKTLRLVFVTPISSLLSPRESTRLQRTSPLQWHRSNLTLFQRWSRSLIRARGLAMGQEHVGKGVNVALGPMMNLGRDAQGGRNWEGFGAVSELQPSRDMACTHSHGFQRTHISPVKQLMRRFWVCNKQGYKPARSITS